MIISILYITFPYLHICLYCHVKISKIPGGNMIQLTFLFPLLCIYCYVILYSWSSIIAIINTALYCVFSHVLPTWNSSTGPGACSTGSHLGPPLWDLSGSAGTLWGLLSPLCDQSGRQHLWGSSGGLQERPPSPGLFSFTGLHLFRLI